MNLLTIYLKHGVSRCNVSVVSCIANGLIMTILNTKLYRRLFYLIVSLFFAGALAFIIDAILLSMPVERAESNYIYQYNIGEPDLR